MTEKYMIENALGWFGIFKDTDCNYLEWRPRGKDDSVMKIYTTKLTVDDVDRAIMQIQNIDIAFLNELDWEGFNSDMYERFNKRFS